MFLRFAKKNIINITFLSLLVVSLLLMSLDVKRRGKLTVLEELIVNAVSIAQNGITYTSQSIKDVWFGYIYFVGLREENSRLSKEAAELMEQVNAAREAVQENQRLKGLLAFKESSGYHTISARVIGMGYTDLFKTITIGKGSIEGVTKGMAVVTNDGVVGRVLNSSASSSRVLLITDRNSYVDAVIQRSRDRGMAEGGDVGLLHLKYLSRSADVVNGDMLITTGIGGIFPKGLVLGVVSKAEKKAGDIFIDAEAKPAVNLYNLEEVLVITDSPAEAE